MSVHTHIQHVLLIAKIYVYGAVYSPVGICALSVGPEEARRCWIPYSHRRHRSHSCELGNELCPSARATRIPNYRAILPGRGVGLRHQ